MNTENQTVNNSQREEKATAKYVCPSRGISCLMSNCVFDSQGSIVHCSDSQPLVHKEETQEEIELAASSYAAKQFIDYGDMNEQAEKQIKEAFKAGFLTRKGGVN